MQFRARLAAVRGTPSRADDVRTVVRLNLEAHDIPSDWLFSQLGEDLTVDLSEAAVSMGPLFEAEDVEGRSNGRVAEPVEVDEEETVAIPSNGRRRHGTRSSEQA